MVVVAAFPGKAARKQRKISDGTAGWLRTARVTANTLLIQGDVLFNLTEENLREMGVEKVGDRLLITDITQTLYEQITGWQQTEVSTPSMMALPAGTQAR